MISNASLRFLVASLRGSSSAAAAVRGFAVAVKETTGLCGYPVQPNWRNKLLDLYQDTLRELEAGIPEDHPYRLGVRNLTLHHQSIVQSSWDFNVVEVKIGLGQVEQLIRMAEDELRLLRDLKVWRLWETADPSVLDRMDASFRTTLGGHVKRRAYEKMQDREDELLLLERLKADADAEKAKVASSTSK